MAKKRNRNDKKDYTKGDRRNSRSGNRKGAMDREPTASYGQNHIEWYVPDERMLANTANIPWGYRTGDPLPIADGKYALPGVVSVEYIPTYGDMSSATSPFNVASTAAYTFVRHANSGSKNYDASDLMLYFMAMDSIYAGITFIQRAIGLGMTYNKDSTYYPHALMHGMGVKWDAEFIGNTLNYINRLNHIILKVATLAVPGHFNIYDRHIQMNSAVYIDEENPHSQVYVAIPKILYKFELDAEYKGMLKAIPWATATEDRPITEYLDLLDSFIDAIYSDEDAGLMAGDIKKAYGDSLFKLTTLSSNVDLTPVYNKDVLQQIHNATVANYAVSDITQVVTESDDGITGYLKQDVKVDTTSINERHLLGGNQLLDIHGEPTPEMVMRTTRFKASIDPNYVSGAVNLVPVKNPPSELVSRVVIYQLAPDGDIWGSAYTGAINERDVDGDTFYTLLSRFNNVSFAPIIYSYDGDEETEFKWKVHTNTDRVTTISADNIAALNNVAMLGLFRVPRMTIA